MSHMVYEDYRKSALKHLKTCEYMIENLHRINENDMLDGLTKSEWKSHVLRNIYYLCGYAIEGVLNYCIYKIAFTSGRSGNDIRNLNEYTGWYTYDNYGNRRNCAISFRIRPNPRLSNSKYEYQIATHDYCSNQEYIVKKVGPSASSIFPRRSTRNANKIAELYYSWQVSMRYQTDSTHFNPPPTLIFNEEDIINYFIFVKEEIYSKLPAIC